MRILVLGAGFGGLELTTRLSDALGDAADIVLIDKADGFVFGFSKLDVMFGRTTADAVRHSYRDLVKPGVRFVRATIRSIDPAARRVETDAGAFEADVMVVALGADLDPAATPGLVEAGQSSTPSTAPSPAATCWSRSAADGSSSASPRHRSSARPPRARPR